MNLRIKFKDYESYKINQIAKSNENNKIHVTNIEIRKISEDISHYFKPKHGMCHGAKTGYEVQMFKKYLPECEVLGTDINKKFLKYHDIINMDFHEFKHQYSNKFDFIYSNSLKNSYNPVKALGNWNSSLKFGGLLYIEHTNEHNGALTYANCFQATFETYIKLIATQYKVVKIIDLSDVYNNSFKKLIKNVKVICARRID